MIELDRYDKHARHDLSRGLDYTILFPLFHLFYQINFVLS